MSEDVTRRSYIFPNKISRIVLLAMRDVMGENGLSAVLNTARLAYLLDEYPPPDFEPGLEFAEMGRLFEAVEGIYGVRGGRRLARQSGRVSFQYWIEGFGGVIGFADFALRVLPLTMRVRIGMEVLAEIFSRYTDLRVSLGEGANDYFFVTEPCGFCWGRHTEAPACNFLAGLLEEVLFWVSRGRHFMVEETTCIASGDPICTFCVDKIPINHL